MMVPMDLRGEGYFRSGFCGADGAFSGRNSSFVGASDQKIT